MKRLRDGDIEKLIRCCADIYQWNQEETFGQHAAKVLPCLIDATVAAYQSIGPPGSDDDELALSREMPELDQHADAFYRNIHEHPLINHQHATHDQRALRMSDVMETKAFHRTKIYNEFYRMLRLPHQMAVGLTGPGSPVVGLVVSRDEEDFSDRERQMLDLFRIHVLQAKQQARRCRHLLNYARQARGMVESLREGIVCLDADLRIRQHTRRAAEIFNRHFPAGPKAKKVFALPDMVRCWAVDATNRGATRSLGLRRRMVLPTDQGSLRLELIHTKDGWTLVAEERGGKWEAASLISLGLTDREAEILLWICQGKSNPEIAIIVGAGARTVEKHVERILKKLAVESRGAAALRALELLM